MATVANLVDERFEVVSLVFRLADRAAYSSASSKYEKTLNQRFGEYKRHPAVAFAVANPDIDYDAVFNVAVHLEKTGAPFALVDNIGALFWDKDILPRWTEEKVNAFVPLLNDFYADCGFEGFFKEQQDFYMKQSAGFDKDILQRFNFKWFENHGVNPANLRVVVSPASGGNSCGSTVYGSNPDANLVYASLPYSRSFPKSVARRISTEVLAHEYCHAFANPIATAWYAENSQFRKWCDDSVNTKLLPAYPSGIAMAFEYITRVYEKLYMAENAKANIMKELAREKRWGFLFIEDVYALVTANTLF